MSARGPQSGSARPPLTASLLRAWRTSVPVEDWRSFDAAALSRDCAAHLQFGKRRRRRQTLLRVSSAPVAAADAAHASYSVIELVIEDMPFLVDTLSMTLAQLGLAAQLIIHPVLRSHPVAACRDRERGRQQRRGARIMAVLAHRSHRRRG